MTKRLILLLEDTDVEAIEILAKRGTRSTWQQAIVLLRQAIEIEFKQIEILESAENIPVISIQDTTQPKGEETDVKQE